MYEGNKESLLEKYPTPITIEENYLIIEQMQKCICKIYKNKGGKGSGFFCYIPFGNSKIPVLITNYHLIDKDYIKNNSVINLTINDDKDTKIVQIGNNRKIYSSRKYDTTIIEIFPLIDKINFFLELEDNILKPNSKTFYQQESIYIMQYPKGQKVCVSYGILKDIQDYEIFLCCSTENGSSGSPILSLSNKRIIGMHKEGINASKFNKGTFLKYPIIEFLNTFNNKNNNNDAITKTRSFNLKSKKENNINISNSLKCNNPMHNVGLNKNIKKSVQFNKNKKDILRFIYEGKERYIALYIEENPLFYEIFNEIKNNFDKKLNDSINCYIMRNNNKIPIDPNKGVKDIGLKNNDKIYIDNNYKNTNNNDQFILIFTYEGKETNVNINIEEYKLLLEIICDLKNKNEIPQEANNFYLMKEDDMIRIDTLKGVQENGLKNGDKICVIV